MRYMFMIHLDDRDFAKMPQAEHDAWIERMAAYDEELKGSGNFIDANALRHASEAMTVRVRAGTLSATDGPYAETKEYLTGYFIVEARDLNDAMRLAAKMPLASVGSIEVRPVKAHAGEL